MENNHLDLENVQMGEKRQKLIDPNFITVPIQHWTTMQEQISTLSMKVNSLQPLEAILAFNPSPSETPNLQSVASTAEQTLSFQITFQTWATFVQHFKALEHMVETLSQRVEALSKIHQRQPTVGQTLSGSVDQSTLATATRTSSTCQDLQNYEVLAPAAAIRPASHEALVESWQTQLSKRDRKSATRAAPAHAVTAPSGPGPVAPSGAGRCTQQSSCACSRCMIPPPKALPPILPPEAFPSLPTPQPNRGGETSSTAAPHRSFRKKIASIVSRDELLDRLVARVQDPPAPQHPQTSRAVASIYISCRLTNQARKDPLYSLRKVFQGYTQITPLGCNLVSPSVAEIFLLEDHKEQALGLLPDTMVLWDQPLSYKAVKRRAASYNRSYFLELRRASLAGLSNQLQLEVLAAAEAAIPRLPEGRRKSVQAAILCDRSWVLAQ